MYLSVENCYKLDKVVKSFEVGYRSQIATTIYNAYSTKQDFIRHINNSKRDIIKKSRLSARKTENVIKNIDENIDEFYCILEYCSKNKIVQQKENQIKNNVLYISEIINLNLVFFDKHFNSFLKQFESIEQFQYLAIQYKNLRNNLSHPACSKIHISNMEEVIKFIHIMLNILEDKYFWYESKRQVETYITQLYTSINGNPIKVNNFKEITNSCKKLIAREQELKLLKEYIVGKNEIYRRCGSLVVYGYGGMGKTALVLEFLQELTKDMIDNKLPSNYNPDFVIYLTSKEEKLKVSSTDGELYIEPECKRYSNFKEMHEKLFDYLKIKNWNDYQSKYIQGGIVVIDNIENIGKSDKEEIINFIKHSPHNIQYIITSRTEERCEEKIYLEEFANDNHGKEFIKEYIEENDLNIELTEEEKEKLLIHSKGNTLIIILSLQRLSLGKVKFEAILNELQNISSKDSEIIVDFMYKNTFEQTLQDIEDKGTSILKILKVMSLYKEPIDLYNLSTLTGENIEAVEKVCRVLSNKLILEKREELYSLNEFSERFVLIRFLPNKHEAEELDKLIQENKRNIEKEIGFLETAIKQSPMLKDIMVDWKPVNYIDKICIAHAFNEYSKAIKMTKKVTSTQNFQNEVNRIENRFLDNELKTSHPYIKFQKARIFQRIMGSKWCIGQYKEELGRRVRGYYEDAIIGIKYNYQFIRSTKSFASLQWIYGIYLYHLSDYSLSIKHLEEAKQLFEEIGLFDASYYKCILQLILASIKLYQKESDMYYFNYAKDTYESIKLNIEKKQSNILDEKGKNFFEFVGKQLKRYTY